MARSSERIRRRLIAGTLLAGGATAVGRSVARRRTAIDAVAPELRNPLLYLPLDLTDERKLAMGRALLRRGLPPVAGVDIESRVLPGDEGGAPGPRVVVYERPDRERPSGALLWIHGGGMVMGTPEQDHQWCSSLADELGILVVSVDYRLAPEHPFPAGLDDCMAALTWLDDAAGELGVDGSRIAVGGASAGGGLAAGVCQRARDEGGPPVCFQLLNYPMLDDRTVLVDDHEGRGAFVWTPTSNRFGWSAYLGGHPSEDDDRRYAAPGRTTDLAGLPPAWIGVGGLDLFHAEDVDYARRLRDAGVDCELHEVAGMYHGAEQVAAKVPSMRDYRASMVKALRQAMG
jgi:acetyl esterase/lipase